MKKILVIVMTLAMVLSLGTIFASAAPASWVTDAESFQPVGEVAIQWDPKASEKLDLSDGKMDDWAAAGYSPTQINPENMVSWIGTSADMPAGFNISSYFVADKDYLYVGFFITDPDVKIGTVKEQYNSDGDSFQMMVDFSGKLQEMMTYRPDDYAALSNGKCIFYSFDIDGDGASINIMRQESDNDMWLNEESTDGAVKGTAGLTETGWCAEFAMSWQTLYDDYAWKAYEEDMNIYFGGVEKKRLDCGIALYCLNMVSDGAMTWAAGTLNGEKDDAGNAVVNFDPKDCGIHLYLEYQEGLEFTCENLIVLGPTETEPPTEEKTEEPTEPEADPVTEAPTEAETDAATESTTDAATEAKTDAAPADEGCASVIGMSAVAVLVAAAAAVVLKKKD